jgi:hypothetical protein
MPVNDAEGKQSYSRQSRWRKLRLITFPRSLLSRAVVVTRHRFPGSIRLSAMAPAEKPEIRKPDVRSRPPTCAK